jgi:hypothetical protein
MITTEHISQARSDLARSTIREIDRETACVWGARAIVAWHLYKATGNYRWYIDAIEYRHEAIEHAGSASPVVLQELLAELREVL